MNTLALLLLTTVCACAEKGLASFYGEEHRGRTMTNGKPFDPDKLTCASWRYPLGAKLEVTTPINKVVVTVTDRGPSRRFRRRVIDLSAAAFKVLAGPELGLVAVSVRRVP